MQKPLKIALLTSVGSTLDAFFPELIEHWRQTGHTVVAASSTAAERVDTTVLVNLTRRPSVRFLFARHELKKWLKKERPDVLITNTATASFISRVSDLGVPIVYFCHGLHWNEGRRLAERLWQALELWALRTTDGVVTINEDDEEWFLKRSKERPVIRIGAGVGVPVSRYPRQPIPLAGKLRLVWVGEFAARKRPFLALDVIEQLQEMGQDVSLRMFGHGPLHASTLVEIDRRGLGGCVVAPGKSGAIAEELGSSHALLHTATWEGLPRVGLESLAVGRPVFAFDVKGVRSLPSVNLAADGEPEALARLIAKADWPAEFEQLPSVGSLDSGAVADELLSFLPAAIRFGRTR